MQVQLRELQEESEGEVERLASLLASINAEHAAVSTELVMAAPVATMPAGVSLDCYLCVWPRHTTTVVACQQARAESLLPG